MENFMDWISGGGWDAILGIIATLGWILSTFVTKMVTNPDKQAKVGGGVAWIKKIMRFIGGGKYLDEDGNWSIPFTDNSPVE